MEKPTWCTADFAVPAAIPEKYIPAPEQRIEQAALVFFQAAGGRDAGEIRLGEGEADAVFFLSQLCETWKFAGRAISSARSSPGSS